RRRPPPRESHKNRPREEEYPWRRGHPLRERVPTIRRLLSRRWRRDPGEPVHRLEPDRLRARTIPILFSAELVPHLAVVTVRPLEQTAPALRRVFDPHRLHCSPKLRQDSPIEIGEPRILGGEMHGDRERRVDSAQGRFIGAREGVPAILAD